MSVTVKPTAGTRAEITWDEGDDPQGHITQAVTGDRLAYALEALGDPGAGQDPERSADEALLAAAHTTALARLLERRAAAQVVRLRDDFGLSWRRIAAAVLDDPDRQSSVRRMYDSGRAHRGH